MSKAVHWSLAVAAGLFGSPDLLAQGHAGHGTLPSPASNANEEPRVAIEVTAIEQGRMGLQVGKATRGPTVYEILSIGTVAVDEAAEAHVHTRFGGWVERMYADTVGKAVEKGDPLVELYSPDVLTTQEEFVAASRHGVDSEVARAALSRLRTWNVPKREIDRLVRERKSRPTVTIESPMRGVVIEKPVLMGMYVSPERELFRIADLSQVWVQVVLYEADVAFVTAGDAVVITSSYDPSLKITGSIDYVYPQVETETRTAKARVVVPNPGTRLKPGMFLNVRIRKDLGVALTVPEEAVIDTGLRTIVFVRRHGTSFEPREVELGPRVERRFVVQKGLEEEEEIVTSAHFLIDAESRLQAVLKSGGAAASGHAGHGG